MVTCDFSMPIDVIHDKVSSEYKATVTVHSLYRQKAASSSSRRVYSLRHRPTKPPTGYVALASKVFLSKIDVLDMVLNTDLEE